MAIITSPVKGIKKINSFKNKFLLGLFIFMLFIILILLSFLLGIGYANSNGTATTTNITSQSILDRVTSQSTLLTKTLYLDQNSVINIDKGSDWSNFLWGQNIDAQALMKIDIGSDLNYLTSDKIKVDNSYKTITIYLKPATIKNITTEGDITVHSSSGILKLLLANDPNADYNLALSQLKIDVQKVVIEERTQLLVDANSDIQNILTNLLQETGYTVNVVTE